MDLSGRSGKGTGQRWAAGAGAGVAATAEGMRTLRRKRNNVGTTYATQAVSSSQVVAGEKLKMPLRKVPSQEVGAMVPLTSNARLFSPGRMPASCRSWNP
jgi:hypothetical protein